MPPWDLGPRGDITGHIMSRATIRRIRRREKLALAHIKVQVNQSKILSMHQAFAKAFVSKKDGSEIE